MNNLRIKKWVVNKAISDILDHYQMWAELTDTELLELIYKEFRKSVNWFYADTKNFDKSEVESILKRYFGDNNEKN